jgi:ankyrin repeat protein
MINLQGRKVWFVLHCLKKETSNVRHMLQRYEEERLFNDRDWYGDDVMSLVAMEGHVCIMELLHDAGAGVSNVNARDRTPLMKAALWGRDDAVKFLLEKDADPRLKDHKDRTALDLARDTDQNRK